MAPMESTNEVAHTLYVPIIAPTAAWMFLWPTNVMQAIMWVSIGLMVAPNVP